MALNRKQARSILLFVLPIASLFGTYSVWLLLFFNGTYTYITQLAPKNSPCPHVPIHSCIFGFKPLDDFILGVECMWGTMIDGSDPGLSLYAFMFSGIFLGSLTVCWTWGLQKHGNLRKATIWPLAFNFVGFGPSMPIFCFLDLLSSSRSDGREERVDPTHPEVLRQWNVFPLSITTGFLLPSLLMVWTPFSPSTHRNVTLLWGVFPLVVLLSQEVFVFIATIFAPSGHDQKKVSLKEAWQSRQFTYLFSIRWAALSHFSGLVILTIAWIFPTLFRDDALNSLSWKRMYALPGLGGQQKVDGLAQGMFGLLQWDGFFGGMSAVVWGLWKLTDARDKRNLEEGSWIAYLIRTTVIISFLGTGVGTVSTKMDSEEILLGQKIDMGTSKAAKEE